MQQKNIQRKKSPRLLNAARLLPVCLCVVLPALFAACAAPLTNGQPGGDPAQSTNGQGSPTNAVVVAIESEPSTGFDPCLGWGHGTTPLVQSTLVRYSQQMEIEPDLATDYYLSEDGLVWTFTLREDAYFTDGEAVTAEDVAFTFLTAKASQSSLDLTVLADCIAVDTYEVQFVLHQANTTFLNTIASVGIVPAHAYDENYGNAPLGSGPWVFVQWNKGEQVILTANQDYYGKVPEIDQVTIIFLAEDAAFAAAQSGQVDVALTSANHAGQEISGMHLQRITTMDNRGILLPMQPHTGLQTAAGHPIGNDVTSDLAIRQALAYGIDRQQIAADAVNGYATPAYSENDGMPWNNPAVKIETSLDQARQLLSAAGWQDRDGDGIVERDGVPAEFTCIYPSGDSVRQAIAMAAAAQAATLGIRIQVEGTSWDDISKRMFSDAVLMGWGDTNPYTSYLLFHSANKLRDDYYNPEGYDNAVVDAYLEAALQAASVSEANAMWQAAQWDGSTGTAMRGDCPWVWLVNVDHLYYVRDGLDIGTQQLHAHGASWTLLQNLKDWTWN